MRIFSPSITGSTNISGTLNVTGPITANLIGTASSAETASFALNAASTLKIYDETSQISAAAKSLKFLGLGVRAYTSTDDILIEIDGAGIAGIDDILSFNPNLSTNRYMNLLTYEYKMVTTLYSNGLFSIQELSNANKGVVKFGDFAGSNNSTYFTITDGTKQILANTGGDVVLQAATGVKLNIGGSGNKFPLLMINSQSADNLYGNITLLSVPTASYVNALNQTVRISGSSIIQGFETISGSLIVSGSQTAIGANTISGSLTISGSQQLIGTNTISGSLIVSSSQITIGVNTISGSLIVSSSQTTIGTNTTSGSLIVTGSNTTIGTNTITGSSIISGSQTVTGSIIVTNGITGSLQGTATNSTSPFAYTSAGGIYSTNPAAYVGGGAGNIAIGQAASSNGIVNYATLVGAGAGQASQQYNTDGVTAYGYQAAYGTYGSSGVVAVGYNALYNQNGFGSQYNSVAVGNQAGYNTPYGQSSIYIGVQSGLNALTASSAIFIGNNAGGGATSASFSTFIGSQAGFSGSRAYYSNFIGSGSGAGIAGTITAASHSVFIGSTAGKLAVSASYSNFIGYNAGYSASLGSYSTLIGYNAGKSFTGNNIGTNNIVIGTNVTLPNGTTNSLNIGGVIFGTGMYSTTTGNPLATATTGQIGINTQSPAYTLDVVGQGRFTQTLYADTLLNVGSSGIYSTGIITGYNGLSVSGPITITGNQTISGYLTVAQNTTITGSLSVTGSNTIIGNNTITGSLSVTGSSSLIGDQNLIGTKTITGSVFISGSKTIIGNNTITGSLSVSGSSSLIGNQTLIGTKTITGSLNVSGSSSLIGNQTLIGTKTITGSVFISGSKTIIGNNTITGSLNVTGYVSASAVSASSLTAYNLTITNTASIKYLNVTYETASVIYSSGSNQFGDAIDDVQTLIGTTKLSGSLQVTGSSTFIGNQTITGSIIFNSGSRITSTYYGNDYPGYIDIVAGAKDGFVELLSYDQSSSFYIDDYGAYITTASGSLFNLWEFRNDGRLLAPRGIEATSFTGSLQGTASYATTASYALHTPDSRPYKVYTALLTQTGNSSINTVTSGSLIVGQTYRILNYISGDDFTNVGASSNTNDVFFVATGTTPANWSNISELEYNMGTPTVRVLENTIGAIWFIYSGTGTYNAISNNLFTNNKTICIISKPAASVDSYLDYGASQTGLDTISITSTGDLMASNNCITDAPIEIRVYN